MADVASSLDDLVGRVCGDGSDSGRAVPSSAFGADGKHGDASVCPLKGAEAALEPHLHIVAIDTMLDGRFVLTNRVSNESVVLPEEVRWKLCFDSDGFGVCEPADEHSGIEPIWLEDIFNFAVYRSPALGYVIRGRSGPMEGQLVVLSHFMTKFLEAEASIFLGASRSKKTFCMVLLRWVRAPACRLLWSAKSVYEQLGFTMFNGQAWRWAASMASLPRWQKDMAALGYLGHVLRSVGMKVERTRLCAPIIIHSHAATAVQVCIPAYLDRRRYPCSLATVYLSSCVLRFGIQPFLYVHAWSRPARLAQTRARTSRCSTSSASSRGLCSRCWRDGLRSALEGAV